MNYKRLVVIEKFRRQPLSDTGTDPRLDNFGLITLG